MDCEVVVVGAGIGGLTVAALLAQRGVNVCLLERASGVGGCAASVDKFDYSFEQGYGLYSSWRPNDIHDRIFSELPVDPPEVRLLEPAFVVRLPDNSEVALTGDTQNFEANLRQVFPECADQAISFYRELAPISAAVSRILQRAPDFLTAPRTRQAYHLLPEVRLAAQILKSSQRSTLEHLDGVSLRFRRFVDAQLQALTQGSSKEVSYLHAALALSAPREGMFTIRGGGAALANRLADSIKRSGGRIRLDTPVLRVSYDSKGAAVGIDLLSGETVTASRAIVSNLTLWDTYGKLVGLDHTPTEIRKQLKSLRGWGAYLLYLGMEEETAKLFTPNHLLALMDWQDDGEYDPENSQFFFAPAPSWDSRAPKGKRAVTVHAFTDVESWFTFHKDETEHEQKDQQMLEAWWGRLHASMPELGSSIEVIDTATPLTFYERTRRKLGMAGGAIPSLDSFRLDRHAYETSLPNLFVTGDTTSLGGIAGVTRSALVLANKLTK